MMTETLFDALCANAGHMLGQALCLMTWAEFSALAAFAFVIVVVFG